MAELFYNRLIGSHPWLRDHAYAYGHGNLDGLPNLRETAGLLVDAEDHDRVGILVLGQQVLSGRVESEIPRVLSQRGLMAGGCQLARCGIHDEDRDAVMAPVRPVDELARGMDLDLGRVAGPVEIGGQGGDRLDLGSASPWRNRK